MRHPDFPTSGFTVPGPSAGAGTVTRRRRFDLPVAFWCALALLCIFTFWCGWLTLTVAKERQNVNWRVGWLVEVHAVNESLRDSVDRGSEPWDDLSRLRDRVVSVAPELVRHLDRALVYESSSEPGAVSHAQDHLHHFVLAVRQQTSDLTARLERRWSALHLVVFCALAASAAFLAMMTVLYMRRERDRVGRDALDKAYLELEEARQRAEADSHAKSRFLADVSHELRTPMNGVVGVTELLMSDLHASPEQRSHLETLQGSARALTRILDNLLDLSKIESGALELSCEPFDLHGLVRHRVALNRAAARAKGLRFACVIEPDVPRFLRGDPIRIGQVLRNLVDNAVKFTEVGQVQVQVSRVWDGIRFEVRDTGPGLPTESAEHLFEPFARLDGNRQHAGSGLGLTLCRQIVEWMGGDLGVQNSPGKGATFWFELDLGEGEPTVAVPFPEADEEHTYEGVRVLVVDDHPINRRVVCAILDKLNIDCDAVVDGSDAVQAVREGDYDLVLMDIEMPRMNGVDATIAIRRQADPIPIIALTAHAMASTRKACFQAGMDDFLAKPVSIGHLDAVLSRWARTSPRLPSHSPVPPSFSRTA